MSDYVYKQSWIQKMQYDMEMKKKRRKSNDLKGSEIFPWPVVEKTRCRRHGKL